MATVTGTHDISTLLAAEVQSVAEFGETRVAEILAADNAAHNAIVADMMSDLADTGTDRQRVYGASTDGDMVEVDEYGRAPTQKNVGSSTVAFPLKKFEYALGWTGDFMLQATPADLARAQQAAQKAHLRMIRKEIQKALLVSANYTWVDSFTDKVSLSVKRLVNADSAIIPNGPNGESFDGSTHTHYNARVAALAISDVQATIDDVVEHGHGADVRIVINRTDEATFKALTGTGGFVPYTDPRMIYRNTDTPGKALDISRLDNRAVGLLGNAELWVKPWGVANYAVVYSAGDPQKPLVMRQKPQPALQGLRIAAELNTHPLHAQYMQAYYGFGVWNRTNGAVLYIGGTSYADPTL
jgi:hypothetical protein